MLQKASEIDEVPVIKTGLFIDKLTGINGIPKQRIIEIVGDANQGKSTLSMQIIAEAQKQGERCLLADVEASFVPLYASKLGVDLSTLDVLRAESAEEVLDAVEEAIIEQTHDLIVIDSIGALVPRAELEKKSGEVVMGGQTRLLSPFMRKITPRLGPKNVCLILINQQKVDFMSGVAKPVGGASVLYHKAISILLKRKFGVVLKQGDTLIGHVVTAEVKKNKMYGNVGLKMDAQFLNNEGFSKAADLLQDAIDAGIVTKTGNSYFFAGEKLGMISKVREWMKIESNVEQLKTALGT